MNRQQHLDWCKKHALEYVDAGNVKGAYASMASDLNDGPAYQGHVGIQLGMMQLISGLISTTEQMRKFIEGFN